MIAEIISIGDELLVGQVVNTNATWLAQKLNQSGISVSRIVAVPDNEGEITSSLDEGLKRADIVLLTGGLGPTNDDITKFTLCRYFNTGLVFHEPTYQHICALFASRGYEITRRNRQQAEIPESCTPLPNVFGTAPGMWFSTGDKVVVSMPGVPFEMEKMMEEQVMPRLAVMENFSMVVHRTVLTHGVGESFLAETISSWEDKLPENIKLAYLPSPGQVRLRLSGTGHDREELIKLIESQVQSLTTLIPGIIYGFENDTMEEVAGRLLREKGHTISTAESCTGGYLAHLLTSVPGASDYFKGSVVAYANEVKEQWLGVSRGTLDAHGAVSEQTVIEMAEGARKRFDTTYAIAISGIAGPDGGTKEKPVGMVWIALANPEGTETKKFIFGEHRGRNIRRSALAALNMLRLKLLL